MKAQQLYEQITADIIAAIEEGAGEWSMPWSALAGDAPLSTTRRRYRGVNALYLSMVGAHRGHASNVWGTYRAWQKVGGQVRKGERATHAILWKQVARPRGEDAGEDTGEDSTRGQVMMARTFAVFAAEQVEGSEARVERVRGPKVELTPAERIDRCEWYFARIGADVRHGGDRAYYLPDSRGGIIQLPEREAFRTIEHYYATRAHETVHWTGHDSRLARTFGRRFGDNAYAVEELTAELGAAMIGGQLDIGTTTRQDHAAYLSSWLRVLREDARAIQTVASRAQAAADYLAKLAGWEGPAELVEDDAGDAEGAENGTVAA